MVEDLKHLDRGWDPEGWWGQILFFLLWMVGSWEEGGIKQGMEEEYKQKEHTGIEEKLFCCKHPVFFI